MGFDQLGAKAIGSITSIEDFNTKAIGSYVKFAAAIIATAAAALTTKAKTHYKTRWARKNFDFYSSIPLQNCCS